MFVLSHDGFEYFGAVVHEELCVLVLDLSEHGQVVVSSLLHQSSCSVREVILVTAGEVLLSRNTAFRSSSITRRVFSPVVQARLDLMRNRLGIILHRRHKVVPVGLIKDAKGPFNADRTCAPERLSNLGQVFPIARPNT